MKFKNIIIMILTTFLIVTTNVYACGEIDELKSDVGTVTIIDSSNFLVTVPEGTKEVTLTGSTRYTWLEGYAPRKVSTNGKVELKVDGNACGYGIYTYFVKFKELSNLIAENEPTPDTNPATEPETTTPSTGSPEAGGAPAGTGNLLLKTLEISNYEIEFDPYKYEYELEVDVDVKSLNISTTADEEIEISVSGNVYNLKEGENLIAITLTDVNGNTNVYNLKVNRAEPKSNNNYLASITIAGHQFNFDPSVTFYELEIGKESSLTINAITESELAQYEILGNSGLQDGSTIIIRVTAEDGSAKEYLINVKRVFNIIDYWIYIVIILLLLLFLILLIIMKQKKNKQKMGPQTIEGQQNTAGAIQEIAPQNSAPAPIPDATASATPSKPGVLKIIEPTDVQTAVETPAQTVDEDDNSTEVFRL